MRLFIALELPGPVAGQLEDAVAPLREAWPDLRWTSREAWHLTLAFLSEVDEAATPELTRRLERAVGRHPRLRLSVSGAGAFPSTGHARVLWAGVDGDREALAALAGSVAAAARRSGAPPASENRRFRPHLTLARCRVPAEVGGPVAALAGFAGAPWTAVEVCLIHSRLSGEPRYETLGAWQLRSGPGNSGS